MRYSTKFVKRAMPLALTLIAVAGCQSQMTPTIVTKDICQIVTVVKLSRSDTEQTRRAVVVNNAALRAAGCAS